ncbi:MAG: ADP-ribosylglycohydrolase family protein [Desulfobacteraceae bacterium]|jgi:ADP-ribosylglycohydrolase
MANNSKKDRAMGAIMGTLIGDALGLGCHWYYDLSQFQADYGDWVSDYTSSKTDRKDKFAKIAKLRHEAGLGPGDVSQTGQVTILLLESLAERGTYDEGDFTSKLDALLETMDGTPFSGRYTDWAMRDVWEQRKSEMDWQEVGSMADTSEGAMRATILAARFFEDPQRVAKLGYQNIRLTHRDPYIVSQSLSFALTVSSLIDNPSLSNIGKHMSQLSDQREIRELVPSFDCLTQVANAAVAVSSPVKLEPASLVGSIYGLACTLGFMLPAAYYLIHRYPEDFEMAVLSAVNGGGNNMARAALTGALSGAMVGLARIPERFISGLKDSERLLQLAEKVANDAFA